MQRIPLNPSNNISEDRAIQRYDEDSEIKFDFESRKKPRGKVYSQCQQFTINNPNLMYPPLPLLSLALADLNLKTRRLIGLVLGGVARYLLEPPDNLDDIAERKDLDVLILEELSPRHPAPNEWSIDWFVRTKDRLPTNGRQDLWFDININTNFEAQKRRSRKFWNGSIKLDDNGRWLIYDPKLSRQFEIHEEVRDGVKTLLLPAGLYLADIPIMKEMVNHLNQKHEILKYKEHHENFCELQNELISLLNGFCSGIVGLDILTIEAGELKCKFKQVYLEIGREWPAEYDRYFEKLFVEFAHFGTDSFRRLIGSDLGVLQDRLARYNWDHVLPKSDRTENALYPVIPSDLLTFTPL